VADAIVEAPDAAARRVELERRLEILVRRGAPERGAHDLREDRARAGLLLGLGRGAADEDLLAARRIAHAGRLDRAVDWQPLDLERALLALDDSDLASARNERPEHGVGLRHRARDERRGNFV